MKCKKCNRTMNSFVSEGTTTYVCPICSHTEDKAKTKESAKLAIDVTCPKCHMTHTISVSVSSFTCQCGETVTINLATGRDAYVC